MLDAEHLIAVVAHGIARDLGQDPDEGVNIAAPGAEPLIVARWKRHRPQALGIVKGMVVDLGPSGVSFLESAARLLSVVKAGAGA